MNSEVVLVVSLWLKGDDVANFQSFERRAAQIMAAHGGRIDRVIRLFGDAVDPPTPFEVHVVTFPNEESFAAYRNDERTRSLGALRDEVIERTEVLIGHDAAVY